MQLKDTVEGMLSDDYKERFKAEYQQLKIRRRKLNDMLWNWGLDILNFEPKCPYSLLKKQLYMMEDLLEIYEWRAAIEGIELGVE